MKVDAQQHLVPVGAKSLSHPDAGSYYMFFHTATRLTTVNHLARTNHSGDVRSLLYLETNQSQTLDRTVKSDEILAGPLGALVAEKTCFYNRPVQTNPSSIKVLVQSDSPAIGREVPDEIPVPADPPAIPSIAVVRFFHSGAGIAFASGNYEAGGTLGTIHHGEILNGNLQPVSSILFPRAPDFNAVSEKYGIPPGIDVATYLRQKQMPLAKTAFPEEKSMVVVVYGFGRLIRQDALDNRSVISSRYLQPVVTQEERILEPECDAHLRQQQLAGMPTVQ